GRRARPRHRLAAAGVEVGAVERGGDVPYRGPGRRVGYPILARRRYRPDLHWYLRALEQALIEALARLGSPAQPRAGYTGVWVRGRKIASIGVHVKQWVTWHGFALNVSTDLAQFDRIIACGIPGVEMTSVEREGGRGKGEGAVWEEATAAVIAGFEQVFGVTATAGELASPR